MRFAAFGIRRIEIVAVEGRRIDRPGEEDFRPEGRAHLARAGLRRHPYNGEGNRGCQSDIFCHYGHIPSLILGFQS